MALITSLDRPPLQALAREQVLVAQLAGGLQVRRIDALLWPLHSPPDTIFCAIEQSSGSNSRIVQTF